MMTAITALAFGLLCSSLNSLLLSTGTTGLSSYLLHLKITAQTEILNEPRSRKEKVKLCRPMDSSKAAEITEGHHRLLYLIRQTIRGN